MSRFKSAQSRVLRRRLLLHTLFTWALFTTVYIIAAVALNAYAVPKLANYIADTTGTTLYYDSETYLRDRTLSQLLNRYVQITEKNLESNTSFEIVESSAPLKDELVLDAVRSSLEAEAWGEQLAEIETALVDEVPNPTGELDSLIHTIPAEQLERARAEALGEDWRDAPIAVSVTVLSSADGSVLDEYHVQYTPRMLAHAVAMSDFDEMRDRDPSKDWQVTDIPNARNDDMGAFEARELSAYRAMRALKVPMAILLYFVGCLVVVMVELGRSLRCFDELSEAVAGLMIDRAKPVELPPSLAIAQGELNRIRLEALADERAAEAAEQRKNELVAYLAHDIRTPLTSVIGYLSLLDEAPDLPPEQRQRFTRMAFQKAERLESLIDEFFEITRYNLQSIPIERSTVGVRLFLEQIADEFFPQASEKDVGISVEAPEGQTFFVDGEKLARAMGNVMRNAVAYAEPGSTVRLAAARTEADAVSDAPGEETDDAPDATFAPAPAWRITVTDRGREISPAHLQSIFEKFYREDGARSAQAGGAGLGLAIAKEIIAAHGGTIAAASAHGETAFTITI